MTGRVAFVRAVRALLVAGLRAAFALEQTRVCLVANLYAAMSAASQLLVACAAAAHVPHVTGYVVACLVLAHAHTPGQIGAGWAAGLVPVAVVVDRVLAVVSAHALVRTLEWQSAAAYGRVLNGVAAVADALVEAGNYIIKKQKIKQ